jgi:LmbE family N-acetylglucosaminyl deacetylase
MPGSSITHIYLSPHPDDAVFSCGGMIHQQVQAGARVVVVTFCTGDPPAGPLSDFAQTLHDRWAPGTHTPAGAIIAARRREDLAALSGLGAETVHLDVPDCIYRLNPATGLPLYASRSAIFGSLHPSEQSLIRRTAGKLSTLLHGFGRHHLYVPLGVGQHVDHQLTRRAAETAGGVYAYYEDYPYIAQESEHWPGPGEPGPHGRPLTAELVYLAEPDLCARLDAMTRYESQFSTFWSSRDELDQAVRGFTSHVGVQAPAERIWRLS